MSTISSDEVARVAALARIALTHDEIEDIIRRFATTAGILVGLVTLVAAVRIVG